MHGLRPKSNSLKQLLDGRICSSAHQQLYHTIEQSWICNNKVSEPENAELIRVQTVSHAATRRWFGLLGEKRTEDTLSNGGEANSTWSIGRIQLVTISRKTVKKDIPLSLIISNYSERLTTCNTRFKARNGNEVSTRYLVRWLRVVKFGTRLVFFDVWTCCRNRKGVCHESKQAPNI